MARRESIEEPLREELSQLRADIDSLVGTVGRLADSTGDQIMSSAKRTWADAQSLAGDTFDTAWKHGRRGLKNAESTIQAHPYVSIAIAAGIGLLIGKLISGR